MSASNIKVKSKKKKGLQFETLGAPGEPGPWGSCPTRPKENTALLWAVQFFYGLVSSTVVLYDNVKRKENTSFFSSIIYVVFFLRFIYAHRSFMIETNGTAVANYSFLSLYGLYSELFYIHSINLYCETYTQICWIHQNIELQK